MTWVGGSNPPLSANPFLVSAKKTVPLRTGEAALATQWTRGSLFQPYFPSSGTKVHRSP